MLSLQSEVPGGTKHWNLEVAAASPFLQNLKFNKAFFLIEIDALVSKLYL